ncbi:MAG: IS630 transposase-related protein [Phototrophicaceae bacterium]
MNYTEKMPNGYSTDLRERVLSYYDDNHKQIETCELFGISRSTLNAWLKLREETGSVALKLRPKVRRSRKVDDEVLTAYIEQHPDAYLREIAQVFEVSISTIWYACQRQKLTHKKR